MAQPAGPSLTRPFLAKAQKTLIPSSPLPQPGALPSRPGLKLPPTASTGLELLPPSSFMLRGVDAPTRVSPPWSPGVPFSRLDFGAVAKGILIASGILLALEDARRPLIHSPSVGASVLGTQ